MIKLIVFILLVTPAFVAAQVTTPSAAAKPSSAQATSEKKTEVYQTIADELLKNCEGSDKKIAVAGFSYSDGRDSRDGGVVAERITTELVKAKKFKVIERKEIEKVFEELKLQRSGAITPDSAKEIGKMLGADWLVVGTLTELPDKQLELNTRVVNVESTEILTASNDRIEKDWLDQYKKLLEEKNKTIEQNPKDVQAFYEQGIMYSDLGEYDNAIASFGIAININTTYSNAYFGRGNAYYHKYDYDNAIADYSKLIEIDPNQAVIYYLLRGLSYCGYNRHFDKAIEDYSKAISIDPKNATAYFDRGNAWYGQAFETYINYGTIDADSYGKAIEDYSRVIALDPNYTGIYSDRGGVYFKRREYDNAIKDFSTAISRDSKHATEYSDSGSAHANSEYDKVIKDFSKPTISFTGHWFDYNLRGASYDYEGEYDKAIEDFSKLITISPKDDTGYVQRGDVYVHKGEYDKAIVDYSKAIAINSLLAMKAYQGRAIAYRAKGESEKAEIDEKKYQSLSEK